jgi:hypothetical protein
MFLDCWLIEARLMVMIEILASNVVQERLLTRSSMEGGEISKESSTIPEVNFTPE